MAVLNSPVVLFLMLQRQFREMVADGILVGHAKTNGKVEVGVVLVSASVPMTMLKWPVVLF